MHVKSRLRFNGHLFPVLLLIIAAGCAAGRSGRAGEEAGHLHRYEVEPGAKERFVSLSEMQIEVEGPMPLDMGSSIGFTLLFEVIDVSAEGINAVMEIEDASVSGELGTAMETFLGSGGVAGLKGSRAKLSIDPRGRVNDPLARGEFEGTNLLSGMSQLSRNIFVPWPDYPVTVGATWKDSLVVEGGQMGVAVNSKTRDTYTYEGVQTVEVEGREFSAYVVRRESETVGEGGGDVESVTVDMVILTSGAATFYFDTGSGMLLKSISDDVMTMDITMTAPMEVTMSVRVNATTTIRRLPG